MANSSTRAIGHRPSALQWLTTIFGIDVGVPTLPARETRLEFMRRYAEASEPRFAALRAKDEAWWEAEVPFFDTIHSRAWIMVRRVAHTAHHRAEQTMLLRLLGHPVHSVYGPAIDTGGLRAHHAVTIYLPRCRVPDRGRVSRGREGSAPRPRDSRAPSGPTISLLGYDGNYVGH
jgi:hypothetical protein